MPPYCCSEKIAVSKNGYINYWKGDFGSDRYNSSKKIESVLNGLKPTSFRLGAEYSIAIVGDEAYFWGCFGPSKYNKGKVKVKVGSEEYEIEVRKV